MVMAVQGATMYKKKKTVDPSDPSKVRDERLSESKTGKAKRSKIEFPVDRPPLKNKWFTEWQTSKTKFAVHRTISINCPHWKNLNYKKLRSIAG